MAKSKVSITEPKLEVRAAQPFVAMKVQSPIRGMGPAAVKAMDRVAQWMTKNNVKPSGPPFWRYTIINMEGDMHLEVGFPVAKPVAGDDKVFAGTLPSGAYATAVFTGKVKGKGLYFATGELLAWGEKNNIQWDRHDDPAGDAWASRLEWYLTDPDEEPDPEKWQTELAFKVR
jgi:effector-binding domain-containing protein